MSKSHEWIDRPVQVFPCLTAVSPEEWRESEPFTRRFSAKSRIFYRDDAAAYGMFLLSGTARITVIGENGSESVINLLTAGEICSLLVLSGLSGREYPGELTAETEVEVLFVRKSSFMRWVQVYEPIRATVFGGLLDGMLRMVERTQQRHNLPLDNRLAGALLRMTAGEAPAVRITHQELAEEVGSVREVVTRALARFQRNGWIETSRGTVRILQRKMLEEKFGDLVTEESGASC
ncbi:CRP/FNR family transcriptional regulator [Paenibacillus rhizosphaerae]|uniref:CRP/FNR family transcriptional regulator n=1 Tax=Paenibacillus rhizosphaerae TaxID=297318 RepID=A0A839TIB2_9BACL|nr:Crp/Fnr family transcriptional regulator [Paenibacillus rhizosphaerae]MBB3126362.1 CRP/FNR family transcriptional regulator [Paenibacillus rhizosphaerae]